MAAPFDDHGFSTYGAYAQMENQTSAPAASASVARIFVSSSSGNANDIQLYFVNATGSAQRFMEAFGESTTPGGANTQIQYNNSNAFGGVANLTFDGTDVTVGGTAGNTKLMFRDSALYINSSADGQLDIDADAELEITAPIVDIDASTEVNVSNALKVGGVLSPNSAGGSDLGSATLEWGDAYFGDNKKIKLGSGQDGHLEYMASARAVLLRGSDVGGLPISASVTPAIAGEYDLGSATAEWGDIYIADDKAIKFGSDQDASIEYDEDGTNELRFAGAAVTFEQDVSFDEDVTLGLTGVDVVTVNGNLTASAGITLSDRSYIADDVQLVFGNGADATIEYDENGTDELRFAGAAVTFEQAVSFDGDMTLGLTVADTVTVPAAFTASQGITLSWDSYLVDDKVLYLGSDKDAGLKYDEAGSNKLIISGAVGGIGLVGDIDPLYPAVYDIGTSTNKFNELHITSFGSNWTNAGRTVADLGTVTTVDINGGTIDNVTIGGSTAGLGTFTTLTVETACVPDAAGGADLGSTSAEWGDIYIADDKKIHFGNGQDATIEYDENGTDELRFAGAAVTFEQAVTFDGDVTLGLSQADTVTVPAMLTASQGALLSLDSHVADDKTLYFGNDKDGGIKYDEAASNTLVISGSVNGGIGLVGNLDPMYDSAYNIGTSARYFATAYIDAIAVAGAHASVTGDVALALPSSKDAKARSWITYSERSLKTDIQPMSNALDTVRKMQGVTYSLKESGKSEVGFIADEVASVVPEVCSFKADGSAAGLDYGRLTSVLVEAIKSQQVQIEDLKGMIKNLKK